MQEGLRDWKLYWNRSPRVYVSYIIITEAALLWLLKCTGLQAHTQTHFISIIPPFSPGPLSHAHTHKRTEWRKDNVHEGLVWGLVGVHLD